MWVHVEGSKGGLVVVCWGPFDVQIVQKGSNYIFCKISTCNGNEWNVLLLYRASYHQHRQILWAEIVNLLAGYMNFFIVGDINQFDNYQDKVGGANLIRGWDPIEWKHALNLHDIPFHGLRLTWSNNGQEDEIIMERLNRAYATPSWLDHHPDTLICNLPIVQSDHAPIILYTNPALQQKRLPYQIEK